MFIPRISMPGLSIKESAIQPCHLGQERMIHAVVIATWHCYLVIPLQRLTLKGSRRGTPTQNGVRGHDWSIQKAGWVILGVCPGLPVGKAFVWLFSRRAEIGVTWQEIFQDFIVTLKSCLERRRLEPPILYWILATYKDLSLQCVINCLLRGRRSYLHKS